MSAAERLADAGAQPGRGFRPASRRRARIAGGAALAAIGIAGNVLVYTELDDSTEVVQAVRNIRAGDLITEADLRIVEADLDPTVPAVPAAQIGAIVNQYARTYIASGTLLVDVLVQPTALVSPGTAIVSIEFRPGRIPATLAERRNVLLVVPGADAAATSVAARVVSIERGEGAADLVSISFEVDPAQAPALALGTDTQVVLLEPGTDPALADPTSAAAGSTGADPAAAQGGS